MFEFGLEDLRTCPGETPPTGSCRVVWFAGDWCSKWGNHHQRDNFLTSAGRLYRSLGGLGGSAPEALNTRFTVFATVLLVRQSFYSVLPGFVRVWGV